MARDNGLRHTNSESPASPGRFAFVRSLTPVSIAAILTIVAAAFLAVHQLVVGGGKKAHPEPAFLTTELGAPQRSESLVRRPAPSTTVTVHPRGGYSIQHGRRGVGVTTKGAGDAAWRSHRGGLTRPTPFGRESILVDSTKTEQYLTVAKHQGLRTWRWNLDTTLEPRLTPGGGISFAAPGSSRVDFHLLPVAILGAAGTSIAPAGLAWSLRKRGHRVSLELTFDDSKLPVPYTIDPAFAKGDAPPRAVANGLGLPVASAASTLDPAPGLDVTIGAAATSVTHDGPTVTLTPQNGEGGSWVHYENGTARPAPYGQEAVVVDGRVTEHFATVTEHQGTRVWSWRIDSPGLTPTVTADGRVELVASNGGRDLYIEPVRILTPSGRDITPAGLEWRVRSKAGAWLLQLELNDESLPLPYIIDPAIAFRAASSNQLASASTTFTLTRPTGTEPADLLLAELAVEGGTGTTITPPAGWTLVQRDDNTTSLAQAIYRHVAVSGDPSSWDWTITSHLASGGIVAYSGVDTASPIDVSAGATSAGASNAAVVAPSVTTAAANEELVAFVSTDVAKNFSTATGMAERFDSFVSLTGVSTGAAAYDEARATAGATGTRAITAGGNGHWIAQSVALKLTSDATAPTVTATPTEGTNPGSQYYNSGTETQWVKGGGSGTFTLNATASDAESGIKQVAFPNVSATSGWTGSTGGTDTASPYVSPATYSWTAGAGSPGTVSVTATNQADLTASDSITISTDSTAPTGASATVTGGYYTSASVPVTVSNGTDSQSGVDASTSTVLRASATLTNGTCGSFGSFSSVTLSGGADTTVTGGNCYQYEVQISDNVGNQATSAASSTAKVDTSAPVIVPVPPTITFRSATAANNGSGTTSLALNAPAGVQSGDVLVAALNVRGGTNITFTAPSGWTQALRTDSTTSSAQVVYYHVYAGGDPSSWTWSWNTSGAAAGAIAAYSGVDTSNPIDVAGGGATGTSALPLASSVTTATANTMLIGVFGVAAAKTFTPPSGMTEEADTVQSTGTGSEGLELADQSLGAAGATGTRQATASGSTAWVAQLVALKQATGETLSLSVAGGGAYLSGKTVYYNANNSGGSSFTLTQTTSDAESGIANVTFPTLTNFTGGGADTSSPYSTTYTWNSSATASAAQTVTSTNNAGTTSSYSSAFTLTADTTAPTGSSATLSGGPWYTTASVPLTLSNGTDAGAGVDSSTQIVERDSATLSGGSCGTFSGSYSTVTLSGGADTTVTSGNCYRYRLKISDEVGNQATSSASADARVDTSAPTVSTDAPTEVSGAGNQYYDGSGTMYFRPAGSGSFKLNASAGDNQSGIGSVSFPDLSSYNGFTGGVGGQDTSAPYTSSTYSWTAGATGNPGSQNITALNGAGGNATSSITISPDSTVPTGQSVSPTGATGFSTLSVPLTIAWGSDAASGLDATTEVVQRDSATLSAGACGTFSGSYSTVTLVGGADTSVTTGNCYRYRLQVADNVGNLATSSASANVMVDTTAPSAPSLSISESSALSHASGTTLYYNAQGSNTASFTVTGTASDGESGIQKLTFFAVSGMTGGGDDTSSPYTGTFTWDQNTNASGTQTVTAYNNGNGTTTSNFTVTKDTSAPTGASIALSGGPTYTSASVPLTISNGTDSASGVDASSQIVERDSATLSNGVCSGFTGTWSTVTLSGGADNSVSTGSCYRYRLKISDNVGNQAQTSNTADAKVLPSGSASYRSIGITDSGGSATSMAVPVPAGIVAKDLLIAQISVKGNQSASLSTPSGWTQALLTNNGTSITQGIYYRVATGGESSTYTWTWAGSVVAAGQITAYRGIDTSNPIDVSASAVSSSNGTAMAAPSVTTTVANDIVVAFHLLNSGRSGTIAPGGMTKRWDVYDSTTQTSLGGDSADMTQASAGSTGTLTATASGSAAWIGQTVALRPDTTAPTQSVSLTEGTRPDLQYYDSSSKTVYYNPAATGTFTITDSPSDAQSGIATDTFPGANSTNAEVVADSPVSYWRLNESSGTSAADSSGTNTGTYTGGYTLGQNGALPGDANQSTSFNGSTGYVNIPDAASLHPTSNFSVEAWVRPASSTGTYGYFEKTVGGAANTSFSLFQETGPTAFYFRVVKAGVSYDAYSNSAPVANAWTHLVGTYDGTTVRLYVNGVLQSVTAAVASPIATGVGASFIGKLGTSGYFTNGRIDDVAVFNTALSAARVSAHYAGASNSTPPTGFTAAPIVRTASPWSSNTYTFTTANTTAPSSSEVTSQDAAGNNAATTVSFVRDVTAPTGASAALTAGPWYTSASVALTLGNGTDSESGVDTSSQVVERDSATLSNGTCGTFSGTWSTVTLTGGADTTVVGGNCYRYRLKISDNVGNQATTSNTSDAKVDTSAPGAPSLSLSESSVLSYVSGSTLYYNAQGSNAATFDVTATSSDAQSGLQKINFPALTGMTGGGDDTSSPYSATYSWINSSTASGSKTVTVTNGAGSTSTSTFTVTNDTTGPTGASAALSGGPWYTSASVPLTLGDGTDSGSGVDATSEIVERDSATLSNGTCGSFSGSWSQITLSGGADTTVATGNCYRYRLKIADNVANQSTSSASADAKVDTSAPSAPSLTVSESSSLSYVSGSTLYYNAQGSNTATFDVSGTSTDAQSGINKLNFPSVSGMTGGGDDTSSPYSTTYTWTNTTTASGAQTVTSYNGASSTATSSFTVTKDATAPTGQSAALSGGPWYTTTSVPLTVGWGSDAGAGLDVSTEVVQRDSATLTNGTCGSFSGSYSTVTLSGGADTTVTSGNCYRYRLQVSDNVGNQATSSASADAKVDTTGPSPYATAVLANSPTGFWRLGETSGTSARDQRDSLGGTYAGTPTLNQTGALNDGDSAVTFDGVDDKVTLPAQATPNSIEAWVKVSSTSHRPFWSNRGAGGQLYFGMTGQAGGNFGLYANGAWVVSSTGIADNQWHHVAFTWDGTTRRLYLDGNPDLTDTTSVGAGGSFAATIGYESAYGEYFTGSIDDVAVYSGVLSPAQVQTHYNQARDFGLTLSESSPFEYVSASGNTLYYSPAGSNSGSFTVTSNASDGGSGVTSVAFPTVFGSDSATDSTSPYSTSYSWTNSASASGAKTATITNGAGLTSAGTFTVTPDSTVPTGQTSALSGGPWYTSASVPLTLGWGSDAGSGLNSSSQVVERDSATLSGGSCGTFSGSWSSVTLTGGADTTVVSGNCYRYRIRVADNVGNTSANSTATADAKVDTSAPTAPSLSISESSALSYASGTTLYYNAQGTNTASFTVTGTSTDGQSGINKLNFPSVSGMTGGGDDTTSPYTGAYTWDQNTTASGSQTVTATNGASTTSTGTFTVTKDTTAPTGQTAALSGGPWYTTASVPLTLDNGSDGGSGLDSSTQVVERDSATLSGGSCGTFSGSWSSVTLVAGADTTVTTGNCYRYRIHVSDNVGNTSANSTATADAKVDTTAPSTPSLSLSESSALSYATGTTLYYNAQGSNSASFTVTGTSTDAQSGINKLNFPSVSGMTGGGDDSSSPYTGAYTWDQNTTASGSQTVTVTNGAGGTATGTFTVTKDTTAPTGQSVALAGGPWYTTASVPLTPGWGSDAGSGLDSSTQVVERDSATLSGGSCGAFSGSWSSVTLVGGADTTVTTGNCYRYRVRVSDNVGNTSTNSSSSADAKVVGSSRVDLQACKLEYSIVSPK